MSRSQSHKVDKGDRVAACVMPLVIISVCGLTTLCGHHIQKNQFSIMIMFVRISSSICYCVYIV